MTAYRKREHNHLREHGSNPRLWTRNFVIGTLSNFVLSCNYFMLTVVMTEYAIEQYEAPPSVAAFCASIFIVGTLFARFATPPLIARFEKKRILLVAAMLNLVATLMYLVHVPLAALMAIRFLHGFFYGSYSTTSATYVTGIIPHSRKGEGIGYYMLSVTLGAAIGPFMGIILSRYFGFLTLFFWAAGVVLVSIPFILVLSPSRPPSKRGARVATPPVNAASEAASTEPAEQAFDEVKAADDALAAADITAPVESAREEAASDAESQAAGSKRAKGPRFGSGILSYFFEVSAIPISAICGLVFFGYSSLLTLLSSYALEIGLSRAASVFFIVYALAIFITRPFTGRAFDKQGPRFVMLPAFLVFSAGLALLAFTTNDWMMLASALLCGYGVGTIQSSGLACAVKFAPDDRLSNANATYYVMLDAGVGIGPLILGAVVPVIGYPNMYLCMAAISAISAILFLFATRGEGSRRKR